MKTVKFPVLLIFFLCFSAFATAQQVHTYVDSDSLRVGEQFTYTIVFDGNYNNVQFPEDQDFEEDLTVNSVQRYQSTAGRDSIVYNLQFFAVEDLTIGAKEILAQTGETDTTITTARVPLFFKTSLAPDDDQFRPMKPIFDFARAWWLWIIVLIILLIAGYYLYQWYLAREIDQEIEIESTAPAPFSNPLDKLKRSISQLTDIKDLMKDEEFEQFYIDLGDAIRLYLKRVYEFQALEMTTNEITQTLQAEHAPPKLISITRKVLNEADIVKFANFNPGTEGAKSALETAEKFIETAEVVNFEKIKFMKYKYEIQHGLKADEIRKTSEAPS